MRKTSTSTLSPAGESSIQKVVVARGRRTNILWPAGESFARTYPRGCGRRARRLWPAGELVKLQKAVGETTSTFTSWTAGEHPKQQVELARRSSWIKLGIKLIILEVADELAKSADCGVDLSYWISGQKVLGEKMNKSARVMLR